MMQIVWPNATASPAATDSPTIVPAPVRDDLVLHLHRLDDADHRARARPHRPRRRAPRAPCPASGSRPRRPLRRAATLAARSLAAARQLAVARLGPQHRHLDPAAVELDRLRALACGGRPAPRRPSAARTLAARRASSSDSTRPWHVSPRDEAVVREQRAVEADERRHAADLELRERPQHPPPRPLAVRVVDDQLRDQRVVQPLTSEPGRDARVDANARARRLAVARDPPRRRHGSRSTDPPR